MKSVMHFASCFYYIKTNVDYAGWVENLRNFMHCKVTYNYTSDISTLINWPIAEQGTKPKSTYSTPGIIG